MCVGSHTIPSRVSVVYVVILLDVVVMFVIRSNTGMGDDACMNPILVDTSMNSDTGMGNNTDMDISNASIVITSSDTSPLRDTRISCGTRISSDGRITSGTSLSSDDSQQKQVEATGSSS